MIPFSDKELYDAVKNAIPQVSAYVSSHGGGITLLGVKDGVIYIELGGTCHGCSMSLMTTNMVIRRELRKLIHPELLVINVDGTSENRLPDDYYAPQEEPKQEEPKVEKESIVDRVKNIFNQKK
ncbi:NifU protein homolog [hydrothermal vent metagenome]|uniref:NifU protein homolog n=1 Tax=hydrothermal vent metagenome TaxID=652676 RepID=A0A1W1BVZ1_9ZZZZ